MAPYKCMFAPWFSFLSKSFYRLEPSNYHLKSLCSSCLPKHTHQFPNKRSAGIKYLCYSKDETNKSFQNYTNLKLTVCFCADEMRSLPLFRNTHTVTHRQEAPCLGMTNYHMRKDSWGWTRHSVKHLTPCHLKKKLLFPLSRRETRSEMKLLWCWWYQPKVHTSVNMY